MPIYEYQCDIGHRFEILCPISQMREEVICMETEGRSVEYTCGHDAVLVPSLCAMQPDTMWSGVTTQHGYFTSKKRNQQFLKENSLQRVERGLVEDVKKKSKRRVPERLEKNEKNLDKFLQKELAGL